MDRATAQYPLWRRRLSVTIAFLLAGFVAQSAVAYWMWYRDSADLWRDEYLSHLPLGSYFGSERSLEWLLSYRTHHGTATAWSTVKERDRVGNRWLVTFDDFSDELPRWLRRKLIMPRFDEQEFLPRQPFGTVVHVSSCGWPTLSIWGMESGPDDSDSSWKTVGAFVVKRDDARYLVPYRPLLLGTLVNTLFFGMLLTIPLAAAVGGRRLWRYERGRCPRCAYDLRRAYESGCPECGWRRAARSGLPDAAR